MVKPFSRDIKVLTTSIAGTNHVDNIAELTAALTDGERLVLLREPSNPADDLAILVLNKDKQKLGYIPRRHNIVIARLMDAGKEFYAVVKSIEIEGNIQPWYDIAIRVYMVD